MKVLSIKGQKDGSAILTLSLNKKEKDTLMRQGLQIAFDEIRARVMVMPPPKRISKVAKVIVMSDADADACVTKAILTALMTKTAEEEKRKMKRK